MKIISASTRTTKAGPPNWMTGTVWLDEIAGADDAPGAARMACVTFSPGARTHWHTHPHGQILHVLRGAGRVQREGEPVQEILPGDTVFIAPGEKHWHGAAPNRLMVHFAVQEAGADGQTATWFEAVSDAQYGGASS
jgi:quercetin dioxygenase-like cupin family protein